MILVQVNYKVRQKKEPLGFFADFSEKARHFNKIFTRFFDVSIYV